MNIKESFGSWYEPLKNILSSKLFYDLGVKVMSQYKYKDVFPFQENIFRAFNLCDYDNIKVVILGQDPYHDIIKLSPLTPRANGLAFANNKGTISISPSLRNIHEELEQDLNEMILDFDCTLENWAKQGVLLLNTALTVERSKAGSHSEYWKDFTEAIIKKISLTKPEVIYILWGKHAQSYEKTIEENHLAPVIIKSAHPSPFSADKGFFGSKPFSQVNKQLDATNKKEIEWIK
jgi:uracil-DNA glycosylase